MIAILKQRIFRNMAVLMVSALTLQSCFVAKTYERPQVKETENLFRTDALPSDSLSMAEVSWKEMFTDPYLVKYIDEGLANNIDIRVAIQQMLSAEAYEKQGKAGYLPTLSAGATATHQELARNSQFGSFFNGAIDQYAVTADLSWEADIWGKIRSNKRAFEANYLQSVAAHQAVKTRLIADISSTYYQLLSSDAQLKITKKSVAVRETSVTTIQALKDAGYVSQVAVDQNSALYNNARALQVDIEAAIFKTENTLSILLGKEPQQYDRGVLDNQNLDTELKVGVPASLLRNRPDVIAAEYNLIQAFELTNVAQSNFYPSLTLTATGGFQSLDFEKLFSANSLFATVVGGLTQPIFKRRQIKTQKEVALARQEQALLMFKKSLLIAGKEVSDALYTYKAETKKFEFRTLEVEALRNAESNSNELLINGYATYLDLLTARQSALGAELNVIDSKLQQLLSVVTLYEALGGGWK
ncbi:efflux transporter outer membrane subunit [Flavobacterium sp. ACAM 123]|jgi:NodT family efflux transporter outer membrane factor (OMF) lipoprotein|uniref:efflux transporter outer membrane subunit n=1 Tax=Flavobacterium sp. ACAM 123 TaxID=1189620 RepID=UPI000497B400|nr:efflux transporter outer membrane subunit [Flavobacterium sp. ACAM 123]